MQLKGPQNPDPSLPTTKPNKKVTLLFVFLVAIPSTVSTDKAERFIHHHRVSVSDFKKLLFI